MPELPEVETIVRALQDGGRGEPAVVGRVIQQAQVQWNKSISNLSVKEFKNQIEGRRIIKVHRRGKFVIFQLDRGSLLFHLRMSGDLRVEKSVDEQGKRIVLEPHDRVVLDFTDGWRVAFNDTRKFGRLWLVSDPKEVLGKLGVEPFDSSLERGGFYKLLQQKKRQIKPLLLDQSFIAGIGNIYTDESLHLAGIHPLRIANQISKEEAGKLLKALRTVLRESIRHNGSSIDWVYRGGGFQNHFRVYQRTQEPCIVCGTPIQRITVGQRGTHFCPTCQKVEQSEDFELKD
jgi:formamidopyrimidine-DNA glycosylase